jgi:hypothetical protein
LKELKKDRLLTKLSNRRSNIKKIWKKQCFFKKLDVSQRNKNNNLPGTKKASFLLRDKRQNIKGKKIRAHMTQPS